MLTIGAVRVGTRGYVYSLFAFNILLILIFMVAILLTSFWADLPLFDYNDLKSVVITSSMGGRDLAEQAMVGEEGRGVWKANPKDRTGDSLQVKLQHNEGGDVELVSVGDHVVRINDTVGEK